MHCLLKNVKVVDTSSSFHGQRVDIEIKDGRIHHIAKSIKSTAATIISYANASVSKGWIDVGAEIGEPGFEHREDIASFSTAAAQGGFTKVAVWPNTFPVIHDKSGVSYLRQGNANNVVELMPIGAVSLGCEGTEIAEMLDMRAAGAVAFSDGANPIQHSGMLKRALLYAKTFDGCIINRPLDNQLNSKGQIHEGIISTSLGMPGIPALAEELMVERDIKLTAYTDSKIHLSCISSAGSVDKIRQAKKQGIKVTASVAALNLLFTDEDCANFDSNYKLMPPLRQETDRQALIKGLQDGTIDCICSNHVPREVEAKHLEFPYADFGAIGLSTSFAVAATVLQKTMDEAQLIEKLTTKPATILGLPETKIEEGEIANLTVYSLTEEWSPNKKENLSKSMNSPLWGKKLKGKALAVFHQNKMWTE